MEAEEEKKWTGNAFGTEERTKVQQERRTQFGVHLSGWPDSFIFSDYVTFCFWAGAPSVAVQEPKLMLSKRVEREKKTSSNW